MSQKSMIIEWAPFETKKEFTEQQVIDLAKKVETEFLTHQPGYIKRELLKGEDNHWADLVYWENQDSAIAGAKAANNNAAFYDYFSTMVGVDINSAEAGIFHYRLAHKWN